MEKILPANGSSKVFDGVSVYCKKKWENDGIKMYSVHFDKDVKSDVDYVNLVIEDMGRVR